MLQPYVSTPKSYYYLLLIKSSIWPRQGPKDNQSVPKYRVQLYQDSRFVAMQSRLSLNCKSIDVDLFSCMYHTYKSQMFNPSLGSESLAHNKSIKILGLTFHSTRTRFCPIKKTKSNFAKTCFAFLHTQQLFLTLIISYHQRKHETQGLPQI